MSYAGNVGGGGKNPYARDSRGEGRKLGKGLVFLVVVAVILVAGASTALGVMWVNHSRIEVTVNGQKVSASRGYTVADAKKELGIEPKPGRLLAIDESVIDERGGDSQSVTIDEKEVPVDEADGTELDDGDVVEVADGHDRTEEVEEFEEIIEHGNADSDRTANGYWAGAIHMLGKGHDGKRVTRTGKVSGISVTEDVEPMTDAGYKTYSIHPEEKVVALTFDDGPWETTNELLDVLEENEAKATFFVIGNQVEEHADAVRRAHDMGCQICTHTWDHAAGSGQGVNLTYMSADEQATEIDKGRDAITKVLGEEAPRILRAPGGNFYGSIIDVLWDRLDYEIGWDLDTMDWSRPGVSHIEEVILSAEPGNVILMHDGGGDRSQTIEACRRALPKLKERGYRFVTVDELLAMG